MNDNVKNYLESYVPDNHWLSKSMEIGKIEYGSYWYLKKMIVYYYYIFILKRLDRREIQEIISNFDLYIDSLPQEIKQEAFDFFYAIDIRHEDSIITLNEFSSTNELLDNYEAEMLRARKFYYSYIMGLQAQNPEKRYILNKTIERRNYFIGVEEAEQKLTSAKFRQQSNDVHAFLRNERQILFLMGLLNYTESINIEEFTPTTIGQTAVYANFNELILLAELQKLRQVSRNPLVYYSYSINRPRNRQPKTGIDPNIAEIATIRKHPYLLFLSYLVNKNRIDKKTFRYLVSRTTDYHDDEAIINFDLNLFDELKKAIDGKDSHYFIKGGNNENPEVFPPEDFSKEFKKYVLGIFKLPKDHKGNLFSIGSYSVRGNTNVSDKEKLETLLYGYNEVMEYLGRNEDNIELLNAIASGHKEKYKQHISRERFIKDDPNHLELISDWLNYFVSLDRNLIRLMLKAVASANDLSKVEVFNNFPNLCRRILGVNARQLEALYTLDYTEEERYTGIEKIVIPKAVTIEQLEEESSKYLRIMNDFRADRVRNSYLIRLYQSWKLQQGNLLCEACGEKLYMDEMGKTISHVHHIIPFNEEQALGPDHYKNLISVCPTCHDLFHSNISYEARQELYDSIEKNSVLGLGIKARLVDLYSGGYLFMSSLRYAAIKSMITQEEETEIIRQ